MILPGATLDNVEKSLRDKAERVAEDAARAPADKRAQHIADIVKQISRSPQVTLDFQPAQRSETVNGRACSIWEEREDGTKRLEWCVVPAASLPGGNEILAGMKSMCQYVHGSNLAFGVEYGRVDPWPGIQNMGGVPVLIREFKNGALVADRS